MSTSTKNQMLTTPFWIKIGVAIYKEKISSNRVNIITLIRTSEISCCRKERWTKHWDFDDDEMIRVYIWHQGNFSVAVAISLSCKKLQEDKSEKKWSYCMKITLITKYRELWRLDKKRLSGLSGST